MKIIINRKEWREDTLLMFAALQGQYDVVKYLQENGADIHASDEFGRTAMHAAERGHDRVVKYLLENKAKVDKKANNSGNTALILAAKKGHDDVVKYLQENGADMSIANNSGNTL